MDGSECIGFQAHFYRPPDPRTAPGETGVHWYGIVVDREKLSTAAAILFNLEMERNRAMSNQTELKCVGCTRPYDEPDFWDEDLCQMCWEEFTSYTWHGSNGGFEDQGLDFEGWLETKNVRLFRDDDRFTTIWREYDYQC